MGDQPEATGDGFGDGLPFPWKGPVEEPEDRPGVLAQVRVEPVTPHVAVHAPHRRPVGFRCGAWGGGKRGPDARQSGRSRNGFSAFAWCWRVLPGKTWIAPPPGRACSSRRSGRWTVPAPARSSPPVVSFIVSRLGTPRCSGVRMFPDMSLPVSCFDRSFQGQIDRSANHASPQGRIHDSEYIYSYLRRITKLFFAES